MSFSTNNNISSQGITLDKLINALGKNVSPKQRARITEIFNKYNTKNDDEILDMNEQIALLNDLHKADANGDVSRKDLRKAGLTDGYKAYRDFIEAYNEVVNADTGKGSVDFSNDGTTNATFKGEAGQHVYHYDKSGKYESADFTNGQGLNFRFDDKGRPSVVTEGNTTKRFVYSSDVETLPDIISVSDGNAVPVKYIKYTKIGDAEYYLKPDTNEYYKLDSEHLTFSDEIYDAQGRVTQEKFDGKTYSYEYDDKGNRSKITVEKPSEGGLSEENPEYTLVNNDDQGNQIAKEGFLLYRQSKGGSINKYYTFNPETREFTPATADQVNKPAKPEKHDKIKMTEGWRNQRFDLNETKREEFNKMLTAEDLLPKLLELRGVDGNFECNEAELLKDLIYYNPSIFNGEGRIYDKADWGRLDFPNKDTIEKKYKKAEEPSTTGASQKSGTESTTEGSEPVGPGDEDIDG